jgi:chromosome segregation ATPase
MKDILKNFLLVVIVAALAIVIFNRFFGSGKEELKQARETIKQARARSDSLEKVNAQIKSQLDSLRQQRAYLNKIIDSLQVVTKTSEAILTKTVRSINVFEGTLDDLSRELNELAKSPLAPEPDKDLAGQRNNN